MPRYQLLPSLRPEEYQALKADIARRGVLVAVEFDGQGNILDGHNRAAIAGELGIDFPRVVRQFGSEQEKREHVLKINLLRRHFGPVGWAEAFRRLAEGRGVRLGARGGPTPSVQPSNCASDAQLDNRSVGKLASELGVSKRTAYNRLKVADELADAPDLAAKVDSGEMEAKRALRVKREREAQQRVETAPPAPLPPTIDLRHGDFRQMLADVPDGSVDLIFTDPPYPREYLPLWSALSEVAARILKPGALLVAYSGQFHLPAVMHSLAEHLEYVWLGALVTPGAHNQVQQRHIRSGLKPLLFYARPPYLPGPWIEDAYVSEERIKDDHDWQQSVGAARHYIERLTQPGDLVVEPFLGSGTTGAAAKGLHRRFIGCEIDANAFAMTRQRLGA